MKPKEEVTINIYFGDVKIGSFEHDINGLQAEIVKRDDGTVWEETLFGPRRKLRDNGLRLRHRAIKRQAIKRREVEGR